MKVLLTGALGNLGRCVVRLLNDEGIDVVGIDLDDDAALGIRAVDLRDPAAVDAATAGADAVVHLASRPNGGEGRAVFDENVATTMNVFQAAVDHGVGKVLFASTIQVFASETTTGNREGNEPIPYLPLDGDLPARPGNPYALSKQVGESALEYFCRRHGIEGVALRFPRLPAAADRGKHGKPPTPGLIAQAFSYLSRDDAARLILALLRVRLDGFRIYLPAAAENALGFSSGELLERYYKAVPFRGDPAGAASLVDLTRIRAETGWRPEDRLFAGWRER